MTSNLERIKNELELSGYNLDNPEFDYSDSVAKSVYELAEVFAKQGHSGYSAMATLHLFKKLVMDEDILTPLTDNPKEWEETFADVDGKPLYQSKRKFCCFSHDLKKYYNYNENGPNGEIVWHKLTKYEKKED